MDPEDAQPILFEWIEFLGQAIAQGMVDVGGEVEMELTSGLGVDYAVHVTSAQAGQGIVELTGRIRVAGTDGPVMEAKAEMEVPDQGTPDA